MLKRLGAVLLHASSLDDECQILGPRAKGPAAQLPAQPDSINDTTPDCSRHLSSGLDTVSTSDSTHYLCERCKRVDLPSMLQRNTYSRCLGLLEDFEDPLCQLCDTIQHFVKQHWGPEKPAVIKDRRPRVHAQGQPWCYVPDSSGSSKCVYRLILAIDQRPPDVQVSRNSKLYDDRENFVLTELEIDPMKAKCNIMLNSARRPIPSYLDLELVRTWLNDCRNHHDICSDNRSSQKTNAAQKLFSGGFRLIDVIEGRLVEETRFCEYVALSYVWGNTASFSFCTNKQNLSDLSKPSSLHKPYNQHGVSRRLPRTIVDAMSLCRSIGQRYLWVDSLCIVQDDPEEKIRLIHGMNSVYENASLTVVALSGVDADAGLAGISPRSPGMGNCGREYLFHEEYGTCCIGIGRISLLEQIQSSYWNTRGWTYQEQILSPRKLYFAPGEVFYECSHWQHPREGYSFEGLIGRDSLVRSGAPCFGGARLHDHLEYPVSLEPPGQFLNLHARRSSEVQGLDVKFQRIVSIYTRRSLKSPDDILHALTGVYNKFYANSDTDGIDIDVLQGIPMRCFSRALLWFASKSCDTKRSLLRGNCPSTWSWTSWITPIEFACETHPNFPISTGRVFHSAYAISLVKEWCLTFKKGDTVIKAHFPGQKFYDTDKKTWKRSPKEVGVTEFMNLYPIGDQDKVGALPAFAPPGLLDFRALYIPAPAPAASPKWSQKLGREWHLSFEGARVDDTTLGCIAIALLDCDGTTLDGFVLLLYDRRFMGICVKKTEEYLERVGVCIFTNSREAWNYTLKDGLLEMYWKQILLR